MKKNPRFFQVLEQNICITYKAGEIPTAVKFLKKNIKALRKPHRMLEKEIFMVCSTVAHIIHQLDKKIRNSKSYKSTTN